MQKYRKYRNSMDNKQGWFESLAKKCKHTCILDPIKYYKDGM